MLTRVTTVFLAFILLWSALGTIEASRGLAPASSGQQHAIAHAIDRAVDHDGSVEHLHLDDLPAQVQNDPVTELPDLMPLVSGSDATALAMVRWRSPTTATVASPALAAPLRPPRHAVLIG